MMQKCISKNGHHWIRWRHVSCLAPSHCPNKWLLLVNWTFGNKFQCIMNQNTIIIFIQEMHLKIPSAKWQPFCLGLNMLLKHIPGHIGLSTNGKYLLIHTTGKKYCRGPFICHKRYITIPIFYYLWLWDIKRYQISILEGSVGWGIGFKVFHSVSILNSKGTGLETSGIILLDKCRCPGAKWTSSTTMLTLLYLKPGLVTQISNSQNVCIVLQWSNKLWWTEVRGVTTHQFPKFVVGH